MSSVTNDTVTRKRMTLGKIYFNVANGVQEKAANRIVNPLANLSREATADAVQEIIQETKEVVLAHVNDGINDMMSEVRQKIDATLMIPQNGEHVYNADRCCNKKQSEKKDTLAYKEFHRRNSLLTDLFQIPDICTVYNIFIVTLIILFLNTTMYDIMKSGKRAIGVEANDDIADVYNRFIIVWKTIRDGNERTKVFIGTTTIQTAFENFPVCLFFWLFMLISTMSIYIFFYIWAWQRLNLSPKSVTRKIWDNIWLTALIFYQILFIIVPIQMILKENFGVCCNAIILAEQTRMLMKSHAFIRSLVPRNLIYKPHSELPLPQNPSFSQYLYFLFAPTLVYRDSYPRTSKIQWKIVAYNFFEVGLGIFYLAFVMEYMVLPVFRVFGTQPLDWKWLVKRTLEASIPGILFFISGNYIILHSWLNGWAELLQFGDRLFYKDWWNCTSYRTYYRTWNVVVHDWLYAYIYKDVYEILSQRNKVLATGAVFLVSAVFHEYIISFTFQFFYPVLFILFVGFGLPFLYLSKFIRSNMLMWLSFCLGNGILFSLYSIEYYARANCLPYSNHYLDLLLPRSWNCQQRVGA